MITSTVQLQASRGVYLVIDRGGPSLLPLGGRKAFTPTPSDLMVLEASARGPMSGDGLVRSAEALGQAGVGDFRGSIERLIEHGLVVDAELAPDPSQPLEPDALLGGDDGDPTLCESTDRFALVRPLLLQLTPWGFENRDHWGQRTVVLSATDVLGAAQFAGRATVAEAAVS